MIIRNISQGEILLSYVTIRTPDQPISMPKKYDPVSPKNIFPEIKLNTAKPKKIKDDILRKSINPSRYISPEIIVKIKRVHAPRPLDKPFTPSIKFHALQVTKTPNEVKIIDIKTFENINFRKPISISRKWLSL